MVYSALLDANVLHPHILFDLLLRLAEHDVFRPLWSIRILDETLESTRVTGVVAMTDLRDDLLRRVGEAAVSDLPGLADALAEAQAVVLARIA